MPAPSTNRTTPVAKLFLFGAFRLEVSGNSSAPLTRKAESLLAYLSLHRETPLHAREKLAALFWGDSTDTDARRSLRVALAALRKALHHDPFTGDRDYLGVDPEWPAEVDVNAFDVAARQFLAGGPMELAEECSELYRGDVLADFYDEWLDQPRHYYRTRFIEVLRCETERRRAQGEYGLAVAAARRILALDPPNETAYQHLMLCYAAMGERAQALQQYEACVRVLRAELGVPPMPETEALRRWIQETATPASAGATRRGNVPLPLTALIGRETEMAELCQALAGRLLVEPQARQSHVGAPSSSRPARLLTFVGPGGSGKTRLALEIAHCQADGMRHGAWWVDLVPIGQGTLLGSAIAKVLGLADGGGSDPTESIAEYIADKQMLLVLDNCEHLIDDCARLVVKLLATCPELRILATSREALAVPGERVSAIPPLGLPPAGQPLTPQRLLEYPAVVLFVERAVTHRPGFRLTPQNSSAVVSVCRRLDGIPLAIELAASRVNALSVEQIAERLDDRFRLLRGGARTAMARQQTLQALIDWSYDLLTPPEQTLFRRLAIFSGGWRLEAAEAVWGSAETDAGAKGEDRDVVHLLSRLVSKSLVTVDASQAGIRYGFLETILAYARERLQMSGESEVLAGRHLDYFAELAEKAEPNLRNAELTGWLDRLEAEIDNLRAALDFATRPQAGSEQQIDGLRLAGALERFWYRRGRTTEGRYWTNRALERTPADSPPAIKGRAAAAAGTFAWLAGDIQRAAGLHEIALRTAEATGDAWMRAWALANLSTCAYMKGENERGAALNELALSVARETGDPWLQGMILSNRGATLIDFFRPLDAVPLLKEAADLIRRTGDPWTLAFPLANLAEIAIERCEFDDARTLLAEWVELAEGCRSRPLLALARLHLGQLERETGLLNKSAGLYREGLAVLAELGDSNQVSRALDGLSCTLLRLRHHTLAAQLMGGAAGLRERHGLRLSPAEEERHADALSRFEVALGADDAAREVEWGRNASFETLLATALA